MSWRVELLSGADSELQDAFNQYEEYADGLGAEFMAAVDANLTRLAVFPEIAPVYVDRLRRQVMQRFPYGIFYEVHPTRIVIVAILNLRQDDVQIRRLLGY